MLHIVTALPAFKYLTGETENVCRLCFSVLDATKVFLNKRRLIECFYCDDTVTYADMLAELLPLPDPELPQMLCKFCADLVFKAFLFKKLSQYSYNEWHEAVGNLSKALDSTTSIKTENKTAYLIVQKDNNMVLTDKIQNKKNKTEILAKINLLLRKKRYMKTFRDKQSVCTVCGLKMSRAKLYKHMKLHHAPEVSTPDCHLNEASANTDCKYRVQRAKKLSCPKCDRLFTTKRSLAIHDEYIHSTVIKCKLCLKQFNSRKDLKAHSVEHTTFQCLRCSKMFSKKSFLQRHMLICANNLRKPEYWCDICKKGYLTKGSIRGHMIGMHGFGPAHLCSVCKKPHKDKGGLRVHMRKHTRERNFSCEECGNVFVSSHSLQSHKRLHSGEKPYTCDECGEQFVNASRRMDHKRRKHMSPQHECTVCGRKFKTKFRRNKHEARHKNPLSKLYTESIIKTENSVVYDKHKTGRLIQNYKQQPPLIGSHSRISVIKAESVET